MISQPIIESEVSNDWNRLCQLVKNLYNNKNIDGSVLKTSLDISLLAGAGLIKDQKAVQTMLVRLNTKLLYKQQKYNLLREETEGYSKLSIALNNIPYIDQISNNNINPYISQVFAIIGQFDLDPNRVLDVIIDSFELQPHNLAYINLLKQFNVINIVHILGNKLSFYESDNIAPVSLYAVTAVLLACELIKITELIPYISPHPSVSLNEVTQYDSIIEGVISNYGTVSLNSTIKNDVKDSSNELKVLDPLSRGDQWLGILVMLTELRCWELAKEVATLLDSYGIDICRYDNFVNALINLLIWLTDSVYQLVSLTRLNLTSSQSQTSDSSNDSLYFKLIPLLPKTTTPLSDISGFLSPINPLIKLLGPLIGRSQILVTRLCRLFVYLLTTTEYSNDFNRVQIKHIISTCLLSSLSACEGGAFLSHQIWSVLTLFTFVDRYEIYDIWYCGKQGKSALGIKHNLVALSEAKVLVSCKALLKRLAKDNTKLIGRQLGRLTHYAPLVVFEHILNQIEHYDNLIPYVVESLRYVPDLSRDALSYFFVIQLQRDGDKMKRGDTHYSSWFSAISRFISSYYKKHPTTDLKGIINLLLKKLGDGESLDLLVLKDLLTIMGGCETLLEVSPSQLEGLAGGKILRSESMGASVKDPPSKKASRILRDELMNSGSALPLLLFIAQIRQKVLFTNESRELKLLSHLYDTSTDVLVQFADFLVANAKNIETIVCIFPPARQLVEDIGLSLPVMFQLVRPLLRAALSYGIDVKQSPSYLQPWHPLSNEMIDLVKGQVDEDIWRSMSPQCYLLFWSLSLYDITVPDNCYAIEIKRLRDRYSDTDGKIASTQAEVKQKKSELSKLLGIIKDLTNEQDSQRKHVETIRSALRELKESFFTYNDETSYHYNQACVYERCRLSPVDAVYCSEFSLLLHEIETPMFSTLQFMDRCIKSNVSLLWCSTEAESSFLGFQINHLLSIANSWFNSEKLFELQASSKIGFMSSMDDASIGMISFDNYQKVWKLWQNKLKHVLIHLLLSEEYMHIRSALLFLSKVSGNFPCLSSCAEDLMNRLVEIEKRESKRPDLQVMAKSLWAMLKGRLPFCINDNAQVNVKGDDKEVATVHMDLTEPETQIETQIENESKSIDKLTDDYELGEEIEDNQPKKQEFKRKLRSDEVPVNNDNNEIRKKHKIDDKEDDIKDKDKSLKDDRKRSYEEKDSKLSSKPLASERERLIREKLEAKSSRSKASEGIFAVPQLNSLSTVPAYPMRPSRNMFDVEHQPKYPPLYDNFSNRHRDNHQMPYDQRNRDNRDNFNRRR
eukprot:gene18828-24607_t